uniref:TOBE domain-containing protein n=1 Tax=Sinorhizobium sp. CCBAU 05631 TaxID=794846 RepID=UPI0012F7296D
ASPPMNILDAEIVGDQLRIAGSDQVLPLPQDFRRTAVSGGRVEVGIRPEALRLADPSASGVRLVADIEVMELTGPELVTTARVGGQRITACLPPRTPLAAGSTRAFSFEEAALHLFDPASGRSVRTA